MAIEHRCGVRRVIDVRVFVAVRSFGVVKARARNISIGGLYVQATASIPQNARVDVVFVRRHHNIYRLYRLPAVVMRGAADGAGVMFSEFNPNAFYALRGIGLSEKTRAAVTASRSTLKSYLRGWNDRAAPPDLG